MFAGPWQSKDVELRDTSIYIGLDALEEAAKSWYEHDGIQRQLGAVFVEKSPTAYRRLRSYLSQRKGIVDTHAFRGEFGDHVGEIERLLGDDAAFVFVDPTGFKGVEMQFIAPLVQARYRDVLINVMFNDVNRWKDDPRGFLREQMRAFFGLGDKDLPPGLEERDLLRVYRAQLKARSSIEYAADLAVPHPTMNRTWFRLVVGGKHSKVLRVFRGVERKVIGREAELARTDAKIRKAAELPLFSTEQVASDEDHRYVNQRDEDRERVVQIIRALVNHQALPWRRLWPPVLEELHLTYRELSALSFAAYKAGELSIEPVPGPRRRTIRDDDEISLANGGSAA